MIASICSPSVIERPTRSESEVTSGVPDDPERGAPGGGWELLSGSGALLLGWEAGGGGCAWLAEGGRGIGAPAPAGMVLGTSGLLVIMALLTLFTSYSVLGRCMPYM